MLTITIVYWKFVMHLPTKTRRLFVVAAIVYVSGVIGIELVAGRYVDLYGKDNLVYSFLATLEESLEMTGVIVFVYALLDYISVKPGAVRFRIKSDST